MRKVQLQIGELSAQDYPVKRDNNGLYSSFKIGVRDSHSSLSSGLPRDVTERAVRNSSNSIVPSPFASNRLNTRLNRCYPSYNVFAYNPVSYIDVI